MERNKRGRLCKRLGAVLIAAALLLSGYNLWDDLRAARAADAALASLLAGERDAGDAALPDYLLHPEMEMPTIEVDGVAYIGSVYIPAVSLYLPVVSAWSDAALRLAPCRYSGSAYLGDMVIAGHDYRAHFRSLRQLDIGDQVMFTDVEGHSFYYEVAEVETLPATAIEEMTTGDWQLTLFTCTYDGQSRFAVRCVQTTEARFAGME